MALAVQAAGVRRPAAAQDGHGIDNASGHEMGDDPADGGIRDGEAFAAQERAELGAAPHRVIEAQGLDGFDEGRGLGLGA